MPASSPRRNPVHRHLFLFLSLLMIAPACGVGGVAQAAVEDTVVPVVTIETPTEGLAVSSRSLTISGTVTDDPSLNEVKALIDGDVQGSMGRTGPHIFDIDISALPEGEHTAQLIAFDSAGNRGDSEVRNFTLDRTIPALSKIGGPERGAVVTTRKVGFSHSLGDEPASTELRYAVDGVPLPGFCPLDLEVELDDGEHTVGIALLPRQKVGTLKRGLKLRISCSEACSGTARAIGAGGLSFRGGFEMNARGSVEVRAKPNRVTRTRLLRRISPVKLKVTAVAADPGRNRSVTTRSIRLRR